MGASPLGSPSCLKFSILLKEISANLIIGRLEQKVYKELFLPTFSILYDLEKPQITSHMCNKELTSDNSALSE